MSRAGKRILRKAAGLDLIGGRPQAQFTGYTRVPGQIPGQTTPLAIRLGLDPEAERMLREKPAEWNIDRAMLATPRAPSDVVKGLGLSKPLEQRLSREIARHALSSPNRVNLAKALMGMLLEEQVGPMQRQVIAARAQSYYRTLIQKSGYQEKYSPTDAHDLQKANGDLQKAAKYKYKVQRGGSTRYYYEEEKYRNAHGTHSTAAENAQARLSRAVLGHVRKVGSGGCDVHNFTGLCKQHGASAIYTAVDKAVKAGELEYKSGRFYAPTPKAETKKAKPALRKSGPFIGPRGGKWADAKHTIPWKPDSVSVSTTSADAHSNQVDFLSQAKMGGKVVGRLHYSVSMNGKTARISINKIEASVKRAGVASKLVGALAKEYGYKNIEWGMMTESGYALRTALDRKYGFDREAAAPKEIDAEAFGQKYGKVLSAEPISASRQNVYVELTSQEKLGALKGAVAKLGGELVGVQEHEGTIWADVDLPMVLSKAGPFVGPRGGKWADAKHTIPWTGEGGQKPGKTEAVAPGAKQKAGAGFQAMARRDAIKAVEEGISERHRSGWLRNEDRGYKKFIAAGIRDNPKVHNATLNLMHQQYQEESGQKIAFEKFLDTPLELYRAGGAPDTEEFVSYSMDKKIAEKFAEKYRVDTMSITLKPRDTFGMINTMSEAEVLVPSRDPYAQGNKLSLGGEEWTVAIRKPGTLYLKSGDKKKVVKDADLPKDVKAKAEAYRKKFEQKLAKSREPIKDPKGGLTARGRRHFEAKEGGNLKPGVKGPADTPEKMRRKGSFLRRHYAGPAKPLTKPNGEPTRHALQARAWGEPLPKTQADVRKLAAKGQRLLDRYQSAKKSLGADPLLLLSKAKTVMGGAGVKYVSKTWAGDHWAYTYAQEKGGKVVPHFKDPELVALKVPLHNYDAVVALAKKKGLPPPIKGGKYAILSVPKSVATAAQAASVGQKPAPQMSKPKPKKVQQAAPQGAPEKSALSLTQVPKADLKELKSDLRKAGQRLEAQGVKGTMIGFDMHGNIAFKPDDGGPTRYERFFKCKFTGEKVHQNPWDSLPENAVQRPDAKLQKLFDACLAEEVLPGYTASTYTDWLRSKNVESFVVGGGVRDLIDVAHKGGGLKEAAKALQDVDLCHSGPPSLIREMFAAHPVAKPAPGADVGGVFNDYSLRGIVLAGGAKGAKGHRDEGLDTAVIHSEGGFDGNFVGDHDLRKDAARRDFTINAVYYDPHNKVILDSSGKGVEDIQNRVLRLVASEENATRNDLLSVRYFKFLSRGYTGEPATRARMHKHFEAKFGYMPQHTKVKHLLKLLPKSMSDDIWMAKIKGLREAFENDGAGDLWEKHIQPVLPTLRKKAKQTLAWKG